MTKTVIERDGSKSITRIDPQKYCSKSSLGYNESSMDNFNGTVNLTNQAKKMAELSDVRSNSQDPYGTITANNSAIKDQRTNPHAMQSHGQLESHKSTTYQTTAHRSSSGAIILNRIATTTTTLPKPAQPDERQVSQKRKIKRIVVKKKNRDGSKPLETDKANVRKALAGVYNSNGRALTASPAKRNLHKDR